MNRIVSLALLMFIIALLFSCARKEKHDYFPLQVGNKWKYEAEIDGTEMKIYWEIKIERTEKIDGYECYVLESSSEGSDDSLQKEYYAKTREGIMSLKTDYPDGEVKFDPPVLKMKVPLQAGQKWDWKGLVIDRKQDFSFLVEKKEKISIDGKDYECYKILLKGRDESGEEVECKRWFADGIGMVREESSLVRGTKEQVLRANLTDYEIGGKSPQ